MLRVHKSLLAFGMAVLFGCSGNSSSKSDEGAKKDLEDIQIEQQAPEDSTGESGDVDIVFGTHIGNPSMNLTQDEVAQNIIDTGNGIVIDTVLMNVTTIKLKPTSEVSEDERRLDELAEEDALDENQENEADQSVAWLGPYRYDLLNDSRDPELEDISLADGTYKRVEFRLRPAQIADDELDPLYQNSMYIAGKLDKEGVEVPFSIHFSNNEKFRIHMNQGLKIEAGVANAIGVSFDAALWFEGLDLTAAEAEEDGSIKIGDKSNKKIYQAFRRNLKQSSRIGEDKDKDGEIEDDEHVEVEVEEDEEDESEEDDEGEEDGDEDEENDDEKNGDKNNNGKKNLKVDGDDDDDDDDSDDDD